MAARTDIWLFGKFWEVDIFPRKAWVLQDSLGEFYSLNCSKTALRQKYLYSLIYWVRMSLKQLLVLSVLTLIKKFPSAIGLFWLTDLN